jgi:hypothetical protein
MHLQSRPPQFYNSNICRNRPWGPVLDDDDDEEEDDGDLVQRKNN